MNEVLPIHEMRSKRDAFTVCLTIFHEQIKDSLKIFSFFYEVGFIWNGTQQRCLERVKTYDR